MRVQARINIPVATPPGSYFLIACADALKRNKEVNERNNCRATKAQITISVPTTGGGTGGGGTGVGSQPPRACANGNDDDGDGVADSSDPGCADASDDSELGTVQCDDGIDNDGDGKTDFRRASPNHDPGCASLTDNKEATDTAIEVEPNDDGAVSTGGTNGNDFSAANANGPFSATVDISAAITPLGDEDVFAIQVPAAATATLETLNSGGTECGISPDTRLYVRNAAGTQLAFDDDDGTGSCSKISGFALSPGTTYYAHVIDYQDDGTIPSYLLRISIVPN